MIHNSGNIKSFIGIPDKRRFKAVPAVVVAIALCGITIAAYMQVINHQFLSFDDDTYVTGNSHVRSGITAANAIWAFTSVEASNWHPLTWLSHMLDVQLYGMNPRGHHITNIALHTGSVLLLFFLLMRLTGAMWRSSFVAALFALHPLHVESVAWVAERKDVLSALFWFLTLFLYTGYAAKPTKLRYLLTLCSFVPGLMAKPMLVTLPAVMLLLDFWPLERYRHQQDDTIPISRVITLLKEKIPFFICSLCSGIITIYAQNHGGALSELTAVPWQLRIENALVAYVKYIGDTLWPRNLAVLYPLPSAIPLWQTAGALFMLSLLSGAIYLSGRRHPWLVTGWLWFIVTLAPVIGIIQVGSQAMADRYTYIPITGLFIMVAWGIPSLTHRRHYCLVISGLLAGTIVVTSTVLTWRQLGYWRDDIALYRHTLQVTTGNYLIHNNLGIALQGIGRVDEAIMEYQQSLTIYPAHSYAHYNLATALQAKGDLNGALAEYGETLRLTPNDPDARLNLGRIFASRGYQDEAIREYRLLLVTHPDNGEAHYNLGLALSRKGYLDEAIGEYRETLRLDPGHINAGFSMRMALAQKKIQTEIR